MSSKRKQGKYKQSQEPQKEPEPKIDEARPSWSTGSKAENMTIGFLACFLAGVATAGVFAIAIPILNIASAQVTLYIALTFAIGTCACSWIMRDVIM